MQEEKQIKPCVLAPSKCQHNSICIFQIIDPLARFHMHLLNCWGIGTALEHDKSFSIELARDGPFEPIRYLPLNADSFNERRKLEIQRSFKLHKTSMSKSQLIIVGGSIGGLTLAHYLQRAGNWSYCSREVEQPSSPDRGFHRDPS